MDAIKVYEIPLKNSTLRLTYDELSYCYNIFRSINLKSYIETAYPDIPAEALDEITQYALVNIDDCCDCETEDDAIALAYAEWKERNE